MKGIQLDNDFVNKVLDFVKPVKVNEETKVETKTETKKEEKVSESKEEAEEHVCPLCESKLEAEIPKEKLEEHVAYFLNIINENFEFGTEESLDEEVEEESEEAKESEEGNDSEQS